MCCVEFCALGFFFIFCPDFRGLRLIYDIWRRIPQIFSFFAPISGDYDIMQFILLTLPIHFHFLPRFQGITTRFVLTCFSLHFIFIFCPDFRGLRLNQSTPRGCIDCFHFLPRFQGITTMPVYGLQITVAISFFAPIYRGLRL